MRDSRLALPGVISVEPRATVLLDRPLEQQAMTKAPGDSHSEKPILNNPGLVLAEQGH
jgi:hypothetical protein